MRALLDMEQTTKIGIIAGGGKLPQVIINSCQKSGKEPFIIAIDNEFDGYDQLASTPHITINIAAAGKAIKYLKKENIKDIIFVGTLKRPALSSLRPDAAGVQLLAKISKSKITGDNKLLSIIADFFTEKKFSVVGIDDVAPDLLAPNGIMGKIHPKQTACDDIDFGITVAKTIGSLDIGQSVVIQKGVVVGVEAIEGTDALLDRVKNLQQEGEGGVLVKVKKPQQDRRLDLPTMGTTTLDNAHKAGLSGIAFDSGSTLILDQEQFIKHANTLGLFIIGIDVENT